MINNAVLEELPVDAFFDSNVFFRTTPEDEMLAAGGVAFQNAHDAVKAYPTMWPSVEAARKALQRSRGVGQTPIRDSIIGKCPTPHVRYQRKAAGAKEAKAKVDLSVCPDPKAQLEQWLGPLKAFMLIDPNATGVHQTQSTSTADPDAAGSSPDQAPALTPEADDLALCRRQQRSSGLPPVVRIARRRAG